MAETVQKEKTDKMARGEIRQVIRDVHHFRKDLKEQGFDFGKPNVNEYYAKIFVRKDNPLGEDEPRIFSGVQFKTYFDPQETPGDIMRDREYTKILVPREIGFNMRGRETMETALTILKGIEAWAQEHGTFVTNFRNLEYRHEGMDIYALNK